VKEEGIDEEDAPQKEIRSWYHLPHQSTVIIS
jgi:hypothetical protein